MKLEAKDKLVGSFRAVPLPTVRNPRAQTTVRANVYPPLHHESIFWIFNTFNLRTVCAIQHAAVQSFVPYDLVFRHLRTPRFHSLLYLSLLQAACLRKASSTSTLFTSSSSTKTTFDGLATCYQGDNSPVLFGVANNAATVRANPHQISVDLCTDPCNGPHISDSTGSFRL